MFVFMLLALGSGCKNILAIAQWLEDQERWLLRQGLTTRTGRKAIPKQATVYRFFWQLEDEIEAFEAAFSRWAVAVVNTVNPGKKVTLNTDGKMVRGTKRKGKGERAVLLVSAYLEELGLTLCQKRANADEATSAKELIAQFETLLPDVQWCLTGDAALTEKPVAKLVVKKGARTTSPSKKIKVTC
jgi:DDE_Tnp_1-associated